MPNYLDNLDLIDAENHVTNVLLQDRGTLALTNQNTLDISNLSSTVGGHTTAISGIQSDLGIVSNLKTANKTAVSAINEIYDELTPSTFFYACKAFGDGNNHILNSMYSTLEEAQEDYPEAVALTDQADWCALKRYMLYCQSHNEPMLIPSGTYMLNKPLELDIDNGAIAVKGEGFTTQLKATNGNNLFYLLGGSSHLYHNTFSDLYLNGNSQNGIGLYLYEISFTTLINVTVAGCDKGIEYHRCDHSTLIGCRITWNDIGVYGYTEDYAHYTAINNISFFGCTIGNNTTSGVTFWRTSGCGFYNCDIEYNGAGTRSVSVRYEGGICVTDCGGQGVNGLTVEGCYIEGNSGWGSIIVDQQFCLQPTIINIKDSCFTYSSTKSDVLADIYVFESPSVLSVINESGCGQRNYSNLLPASYTHTYPASSSTYTTINRTNNYDVGDMV